MDSSNLVTREVWEGNLDEELAIIRGICDDYPYVAMDTEFPGVVRFRPLRSPRPDPPRPHPTACESRAEKHLRIFFVLD